MNLREVRDILSDPEIPLSGALLKAKVLASIVRARELRVYVDREMTGYPVDAHIPSYRQIPIDSVGTFINPPQFKPVENHRVPTSDLPEKLRAWAETYACADSIGAIEKLIATADQHMIWMPWPHENVAFIPVVDIGGFGFRCTDACRCFSTEKLQSILDNVRNRVLDIVLDLGEQFPEQQDSEQQLTDLPAAQVQTIINNHIHGDFATVAAGAAVQQSVLSVQQNDIDSLIRAVKQLGLPQPDQEALRSAIEEDAREAGQKKLGSRVRQWLGQLTTKAVEKSVETGITAALPQIIEAVSKFFG